MHIYRKNQAGKFQVEFYDPQMSQRRWIKVREFVQEADAAAFVAYLNGGAKPNISPDSPPSP